MTMIEVLIGLAVGVVGTLIVMNNRNSITKKALQAEQLAKADLQKQLDTLAKKV